MEVRRLRRFEKSWKRLATTDQKRARAKLALFLEDPSKPHPSLRVKRVKSHATAWDGSITMSIRFTFEFRGGEIIFRNIGPHDKTLDNP